MWSEIYSVHPDQLTAQDRHRVGFNEVKVLLEENDGENGKRIEASSKGTIK